MTYNDLQKEMASRGFMDTGISEAQYEYAVKFIGTSEYIVDVAMDVMSGISFGLALELNQV